MSRAGLAQCHPHDQAALAWLQLFHMNQTRSATPYGYECTKRNACEAKTGRHWSCIPLWHAALRRAHAWASPRFRAYDRVAPRWHVDEVVDRGLANGETPLFHVATEDATRPRLQCFRCATSLRETSFSPGRNYPVPADAARGWLVNHKGQALFYRAAFNAQSDDATAPCFVSAEARAHFKD